MMGVRGGMLRCDNLGSDPPRQAHAPGLERRPARHLGEQHVGSIIEALTRKSVPAYRDPPLPIDFTGLVASRREAEIGANCALAGRGSGRRWWRGRPGQ